MYSTQQRKSSSIQCLAGSASGYTAAVRPSQPLTLGCRQGCKCCRHTAASCSPERRSEALQDLAQRSLLGIDGRPQSAIRDALTRCRSWCGSPGCRPASGWYLAPVLCPLCIRWGRHAPSRIRMWDIRSCTGCNTCGTGNPYCTTGSYASIRLCFVHEQRWRRLHWSAGAVMAPARVQGAFARKQKRRRRLADASHEMWCAAVDSRLVGVRNETESERVDSGDRLSSGVDDSTHEAQWASGTMLWHTCQAAG